MKASTLKLCLPVIAITVQNNVGALIIPPFLHDLNFSVATIGSLISLGPVLALLSRIPAGVAYKKSRARALIAIAMIAMAVCNFLYRLADDALVFALVHGANGFAYGAVTTLYMAFYVDSLAPDENRNHAMGYYVGCLAVGYSIGNFLAGAIADHFGYHFTFGVAAFLSVLGIIPVWSIKSPTKANGSVAKKAAEGNPSLRDSLKAVLEPNMAGVVIVALFLNALHQVGNVFLPLYGLAVGMTLTQVGVIRAFYSLCNAITRPISGFVVNRFGHRRLSYGGLPLQSALMMLVPLFADFGSVLAVYICAGFMRAVAIVSNAVSLVQDVDESTVRRGVATGIYNAAGDLGNILGPSAGGLIASATGVAGMFVVAPVGATTLFLLSIGVLQLRAKKSR
jgi:predicted MFS family arabinose efflux permease